MNKANLKSYAPKARLDFIKAVTERANVLGISATGTVPAQLRGDIAIIDGREWPAKVVGQRDELITRIKRHGFEQTMDEVAYTWFNRFAALRYMEIHDYLGHGWRVLSSRDGGLPEILRHASEVTLPGLNADLAREIQLAGNQDNELYRLLLVAQCNDLAGVMPFLFERIDDETELLFPENLLRTDSIVAKLVSSVPEEDWQEIEVIGWLYQFYISEKKDQVIGKVVRSEDIPAATQLFTPNWIVKYMVQNSLGAQWMATYPDSKLKSRMAYYIDLAEQTNEVKAKLAAITPSQLNPDELTLIDPASGSGHILVEAYELFKAIYLERGYRQRDIPRLILEKNLYGLDIDERAAQLTGFALMMKARSDDRRLFERGVNLNVMALVDSSGFDAEGLAHGVLLADYGLEAGDLTELKRLFEHAPTFGSLITVPEVLAEKLTALRQLCTATSPDLFVSGALKRLRPLVQQASLLASRYDAVVANPPYMGSGAMDTLVKNFTRNSFPNGKSDLFACFIERGSTLAKDVGYCAMVTMDSWMFLSSYTRLRQSLLQARSINSLVHVGWNCFPQVHTYHRGAAFVLKNEKTNLIGTYVNLSDVPATVDKDELFLSRLSTSEGIHYKAKSDFRAIPNSSLAYGASERVIKAFGENLPLGRFANPSQALVTGNTERHIRDWREVSLDRIGFGFHNRESAKISGARWFPYNKGGPFRNWYGNYWFVVNWENDGQELQTTKHPTSDRIWAHNFVLDQIFNEALVWAKVTSGHIGFRYSPDGYLFDDASGVCSSISSEPVKVMLAFLVSPVAKRLAAVASPTLNMQPGDLSSLPYIPNIAGVKERAEALVAIARSDWNLFQHSWDFQSLPILTASTDPSPTLESSYTAWITQNKAVIEKMKLLEEEINRLFIDAYELAQELSYEVPIEQITLTVNPAYRYGGNLSEEEQWTRFRKDTMGELISYSIACIMGRYSLDEPGLIYAHHGNEGFDPGRYQTFAADADGIVPVTDELWFEDDAANRVREFIRATWGTERLDENMAWLANNLSGKANETSEETIRRYLADEFFDDHIQSYRKRPIYWLFSSGKQSAFKALIYVHRYNEGTLARMRAEYVVPLIAKVLSRLEMLDKDVAAASSAAARTKLQKQIESLRKKQIELLAYDEKLRHYADMRITLNLDDGVKVNYAKFGDLVAEAKAITGGSDE